MWLYLPLDPPPFVYGKHIERKKGISADSLEQVDQISSKSRV